MGSVGTSGFTAFNNPQYNSALRSFEDSIRNQSYETLGVIAPNGDILLDKTNNSTNSVSFDDSEKYLMTGATITHNHPSGTTFSWQDLKTLEDTGAHEIRAVGANGVTYSLVSGPNASTNLDFTFNYYKAENTYQANVVDKIWLSSKQTQADADKCNKMLADYRRKWLKDNSKKYGYTYSERKTK